MQRKDGQRREYPREYFDALRFTNAARVYEVLNLPNSPQVGAVDLARYPGGVVVTMLAATVSQKNSGTPQCQDKQN